MCSGNWCLGTRTVSQRPEANGKALVITADYSPSRPGCLLLDSFELIGPRLVCAQWLNPRSYHSAPTWRASFGGSVRPPGQLGGSHSSKGGAISCLSCWRHGVHRGSPDVLINQYPFPSRVAGFVLSCPPVPLIPCEELCEKPMRARWKTSTFYFQTMWRRRESRLPSSLGGFPANLCVSCSGDMGPHWYFVATGEGILVSGFISAICECSWFPFCGCALGLTKSLLWLTFS